MTYEKEKQTLEKKYKAQRKWTQATQNYGFWSYPYSYYKELVSIVLSSKIK
jgi:hypothetical protein